MREWLGLDPADDPDQGVQSPANLIGGILKSFGLTSGLELETIRSTWAELAGEFIAQHSDPVSIKNGAMVLRVTQPVMRFQLEQMKPLLLRQLQEKLGAQKIRSLSFTIG